MYQFENDSSSRANDVKMSLRAFLSLSPSLFLCMHVWMYVGMYHLKYFDLRKTTIQAL